MCLSENNEKVATAIYIPITAIYMYIYIHITAKS